MLPLKFFQLLMTTLNVSQANMKHAPTERVSLWLVSNRSIVHFLSVVRLNDCNIDASYLLNYTEEDQIDPLKRNAFPGPILELLTSHSMIELDLSNNPLFIMQ